ncbi:sulfate transporter-like isoform X2 [Lingula anatina]|uniref:Sulfate transporter-like isoform X2 n=1 Tax=Lingula anatina TaxID=7574 RepID=A0A2R2MPD6_LINAN|nr:sulfate transporter-like isoform X2 [Lingula anatina]|eukprot:XP_023932100.1 sulfate transporter-like isoform X2 [Lingula anatina]
MSGEDGYATERRGRSISVQSNDSSQSMPSVASPVQYAQSCSSLMYTATPGTLKVERPVYNQVDFDSGFEPSNRPKKPVKEHVRTFFSKNCICSKEKTKEFFLHLFPCINIMRNYQFPGWLIGDMVAGLTVGIMHLPQGMAYALLAKMPPIVGLYVSFFPVLMYFFFGTSKHISIGTFAVICLMVGESVVRETGDLEALVTDSVPGGNGTNGSLTSGDSSGITSEELDNKKIEIATALTLLVGLWQITMGIFRMGFLTIYLSDALISGFTTGAACHVFTTQVKYVFGLHIPRSSEPFKIIKTYVSIFSNITKTNFAAVIISVTCILCLALVKECINARYRSRMKMPVPIELIVVVLGTLVSYLAKLHENFNVTVVGHIPTGIPAPKVPPTEHMGALIGDSFAVAIVAFSISVSMGKLLARKHDYEVTPNQELVAYGLMNIFSSFFNCFAACASLSRSLVQDNVGGRTQLAAVFSSVLILIVLLVLGPLFQTLPNAVLASIILVALKGMFLQFKDLKNLWHICKFDFAIWLVTWLAVVLLGVAMGLIIGVGFSLLTVVFRTQSPYTCLYGRVPHTDIYRDKTAYKVCKEIPGIKIFHFESALYYANAEHFRRKIFSQTGANPVTLKKARNKLEEKQKKMEEKMKKEEEKNGKVHENGDAMTQEGSVVLENCDVEEPPNDFKERTAALSFNIHHVIIDCSSVSYIDSGGVKMLSQVMSDYKEVGVAVFLAHCKRRVRKMFRKAGLHKKHEQDLLYITIHDAVIAALRSQHDLLNELKRDASVSCVHEEVTVGRRRTNSLRNRASTEAMQQIPESASDEDGDEGLKFLARRRSEPIPEDFQALTTV